MTSPLHLKVVSIAGALSSAEASLCCREAGKKETEGARGIVHRALFIFLLLLFLLVYPPGGDATPSGFIYLYIALLLARVASVSVRLRSKERGRGQATKKKEREFLQRERSLRTLCRLPCESCQVA